MNTELLISDSIIPLRTSDTGEEALAMMNDFYVRHLPIVNNTELLGLIAEDDILDNDPEEAVGTYSLSLVNAYVRANDHIYETLRLLSEYQLTLVPVVDDENNYIGLVTLEDIVHYFAKTASFSESGSILVLEVNKHNYTLSEIARIVESENATIISAFITSTPEYAMLDVTIKINRQNIGNIIASFLRYDYTIKASFNEQEYIDSLKDRYDSLMAYLSV